ncbi:peptide chain release factor N(5)-glutamine methyltransferase [Cognaticolwellia mytili]|uniref:peptide chain release factor N(5)-glutamine methyltransferase n=1 Tax=Cognaticolwellia mytili TaxID=1888913 RepID=UPI000A172E8F|nr:peptide chain release factor N(5)-glutamine methyltransferase [Cognaticolwellia mytili]
MAIAKLIAYGQQHLLATSDSAKLDVELLICFVIDKPRTYLLTWPEQILSLTQTAHFAELLLRRIQGEPIAYIVEMREFWSLPLQVSPATLIPRPDTEVLVELVLNNHSAEGVSCLDLGTGTGAIALALASEQGSWQIDAVDFSNDAVALAKTNASNLNLTQVKIFQSNWFSAVAENKHYDVIVSNPPYIDEQDCHLAQGDVRFEPKTALVAADSGLADIKIIVSQARNYFNQLGYLYIEHGFEQSIAVQDILADHGYEKIQTFKDYNDNDRITCGCFIID